jgi:formylglycine-generating enzyme required for sulfatase activity
MVALVAMAAVVRGQGSLPAAPGEFSNSVGMKLVRIDPGSFKMGAEGIYGPVHDVTLSNGFYLQTTAVTQAQWQAVMRTNPSELKGPDRPVEQVSWDDVQEFLRRLNAREKDTRYRLPTEAEWEYACRAGGQEPDEAPNLDVVAWWGPNSGGGTHPVGQKKPNAWGLYDMRGNVWEWVRDWYARPYSVEPHVDPQGPPSGENRVVRGGSWFQNDPAVLRCASRRSYSPDYASNDGGFRCARAF